MKMNKYWKEVNHALDMMEKFKYDRQEYQEWERRYRESMNLYLIVKNS